MRRKLIRRLTILAIACLVLAVGAGGFYVYRKASIRRQFAQYRAQGLAAARDGHNAQAMDLLERYLQRYPDDVDSLVQYARIRPQFPLPKNQHIAATIYALRHLLKLDNSPARLPEKKQLLDLYVRLHYWAEAQALCDELLPQGKAPAAGDAPVLAARTQAAIAQRDWSGALDWACQWSKLAPTDLQPQLTVLDLLHQTQDYHRFASLSTGSKPVTEIEVAQSLAKQIGPAFAAAGPSTQPSGNPRSLIIVGHGALLAGKIDVALADFRAAASSASVDRDTAAALIREFDAVGDSNEAIPVLKRLVRETNDPLARSALARRSWEANDFKSVDELTSDLKATDSQTSSELLALRAGALQRLGRAAEAADIQRALAARQGDAVANAWAFILQGSASAPMTDARQVVRLCAPAADSSAYLSFFLADAQARLGETELAISTLQKTLEMNSTWGVPAVRLSELLAQAGRYEPARQAGRQAVRRQPTYQAILSLYRAWDLCLQNNLTGNADQLIKGLQALQAHVKDDGAIACIRADVLAATGDTAGAAAVIRDLLKATDHPAGESSLLQMAGISRKYKLGLDQDCLAACQSRYGGTAELAYATAAAHFARGDAAGGLKTFQELRAHAREPRSTPWLVAWARYLDLVQDPRAKAQLVELADSQPSDLNVQMLALDARATRDDRAFMLRTIDRVRQLTGDSAIAWQLAKARWLLIFGASTDATEAQRLLGNVVRVAPENPEAHVLLARCAESDGRVTDAISQMRVATGLLPNSSTLGLNLARLLELAGDFDGARDELSHVRAMPASDAAQRRSAAVLAAQAGDTGLALALAQDAAAQSAIASAPNDLLLAQLYWHDGKAPEALALCEKLLANPDLPVIQLAADLYAAQGRMDDAARVLGKLSGLKLEPGVKELALADFAARYSGPDAALKHLEQAAAEAPTSPQVWKALVLFHAAAGHAADAAAAITQGLQHVPADPVLGELRKEAQRLTIATAQSQLRPFAVAFVRGPQDPAARDALVRFTDDAQGHVNAARLADDARAVADAHPQFLAAWMFLVQCDQRAGRMDDAINNALRTAHQFPGSPEAQAMYVELLVHDCVDRKQNRWQEVLAEAQKWRDRSLSNPLPADLQIAEADLKLNRAADALRQLDPYVRNSASAPQAYNAVLPLYAQARQAAGQTGQAALLEPLLQQGPRGRETWIAYAVQNLDPTEAVAWLERVQKLIPADSVPEQVYLAQSWMALAQGRQYAPAGPRALAILRPLGQKSNAAAPVVLALAMAEEASGNLDEAQTAYRRVIQLDPNDIVAHNNLAMVLARSGKGLDDAAKLAQEAIRLRPDVPSLYDTLAFVQNRLHRFDDAAGNARTAIRLQPKDVQYRLTLLQVLMDSGKKQDAQKALGELDALHADPAALAAPVRQQLESIRQSLKFASAQANGNG